VAEPKKTQVPQQPKEAPKEAQKPEKPVIAEGEVACEGCGHSITRNQEKLSRLLTGKSLCKKCMNPP
jgi:formylmethanofuran dehydrogenase subunit E